MQCSLFRLTDNSNEVIPDAHGVLERGGIKSPVLFIHSIINAGL